MMSNLTQARKPEEQLAQATCPSPRSRFRPQPRTGLTLGARDVSLVTDVFLNRVMTRRQIQVLHFGSTPRCNARLRLLYDWGYLDRSYLPTAPFGSPALYTVGKAAAPLVTDFLTRASLKADPEDVRRQVCRPALSLLEHTLAIGDVYLALRSALVIRPDVRLEYWLPERFCRHEYEVRRREQDGQSGAGCWRKEVFAPDGFFRLIRQNPAGECNCFLEVDLGHTNSRQFAGKLRTHARFLESGLFEEAFGWDGFQTLVITTSDRRADNLQVLAMREDDHLFRFTTFAAVNQSGLLALIWHGPSRSPTSGLL